MWSRRRFPFSPVSCCDSTTVFPRRHESRISERPYVADTIPERGELTGGGCASTGGSSILRQLDQELPVPLGASALSASRTTRHLRLLPLLSIRHPSTFPSDFTITPAPSTIAAPVVNRPWPNSGTLSRPGLDADSPLLDTVLRSVSSSRSRKCHSTPSSKS